MREYDNLFGSAFQNSRGSDNGDFFKEYMDKNLNEIDNISVFLPEADLLKILQFMITNKPKGKESEFQKFLDGRGRDGYALIHYLCYLRKIIL